jgi:putative lumazine-binding protein
MITSAGNALLAAMALADTGGYAMPTTSALRVHETPAEAVAAYFDGRDHGSTREIRTAFHPDAPLQSVGPDGAPRILEQAEWWSRIEAGTTPATHNEQTLLDREGGMALVECTSRWATHEFRDLLILADTPDGWRIVGKAFTRIAAGDTLPAPAAADAKGIREAVRVKIAAHAEYDPALLVASHLPACRYFRVHVDHVAFEHNSLSQGAARYAGLRERGVRDPDSKWRVLEIVQRGDIGAVKLDVIVEGMRYIDYLLLLRTAGGWKIAAAVWGDPAK